jgi:sulfatase modifying factor 1
VLLIAASANAACGLLAAESGSGADTGGRAVPAVDGGGASAGGGADGSSVSSPCRGGIAADTALPPSCAPGGTGMTNCGEEGNDSCCTSLEVCGGTFHQKYFKGGPNAVPYAYPTTVSDFRLDKYLVTVGRFRQFVNAWNGGDGYTPSAGSGKHMHLNRGKGLNATGGGFEPGWVTADDVNIAPTAANLAAEGAYAAWTASPGSQENLPIDGVNWYEAYAFCIWDGGFLPSEAEWTYAAAGGSQQREYPWGSIDPGTGNQYAIYNCYYPMGPGGYTTCTGAGNIAPVGTATLGAGLWGQLDLAGEVWQWNLDWYAVYAADAECTDCADFTASVEGRACHGGDFGFTASDMLSPYRFNLPPTFRANGFRCARAP